MEAATQWVIHDGGAMERRTILAVSSAALLAGRTRDPASRGVSTTRSTGIHCPAGLPVTGPVTEVIAATVDAVRRLDDAEGGNRSSLQYAHQQFALIAEYVRRESFTTPAVRVRMVNLWAQLAQTVGWMAMDAGLHGLAQRYFRTGLAAAHESGDLSLTSHLHGCLTYQAITLGRIRDAIDLANAGITAARTEPPAVRALAAARHAHAHAAFGDVHGLRQSTDEARSHLDHPDALDSRPSWLYWLTDLDVVTGQTLITAGFANSPGASRLLDEADPLITPWLGTHAEQTETRDALLHGTWLARSYLRRDDLEQTLATATSLLRYATTVQSAQVTTILHGLCADLDCRDDLRNHPGALELRKQLKAAAGLP